IGCGILYDIRGGLRNLRINDVVTTWSETGQAARKHTDFNDCFTYLAPDPNQQNATYTDCREFNPTRITEYGFDGTAARVTTRSYLHNDATVGASYLNRHIVDLAQFQRTYDGDGATLRAETEYRYDTIPLQDAGSPAPPYWSSVAGVRGNQTEVRQHRFAA